MSVECNYCGNKVHDDDCPKAIRLRESFAALDKTYNKQEDKAMAKDCCPEQDPYRMLLIEAGVIDLNNDPEFEIDEDKFSLFLCGQDGFYNPEKFLDFMRRTLCTYPAINDFLIQTLALANKDREHFDT